MHIIHCCRHRLLRVIAGANCGQEGAGLQAHLVVFLFNARLDHDGSACPDGHLALIADRCPDDDVEVEGIVEADEADAAGVDPTRAALKPAGSAAFNKH